MCVRAQRMPAASARSHCMTALLPGPALAASSCARASGASSVLSPCPPPLRAAAAGDMLANQREPRTRSCLLLPCLQSVGWSVMRLPAGPCTHHIICRPLPRSCCLHACCRPLSPCSCVACRHETTRFAALLMCLVCRDRGRALACDASTWPADCRVAQKGDAELLASCFLYVFCCAGRRLPCGRRRVALHASGLCNRGTRRNCDASVLTRMHQVADQRASLLPPPPVDATACGCINVTAQAAAEALVLPRGIREQATGRPTWPQHIVQATPTPPHCITIVQQRSSSSGPHYVGTEGARAIGRRGRPLRRLRASRNERGPRCSHPGRGTELLAAAGRSSGGRRRRGQQQQRQRRPPGREQCGPSRTAASQQQPAPPPLSTPHGCRWRWRRCWTTTITSCAAA